MRKKLPSPFHIDLDSKNEQDKSAFAAFRAEFDMHCRLDKSEKNKLQEDFENAFAYYDSVSLPLKTALTRLDPKNLGGFYARPSSLWFALDDAAKIYPISMEHGRMAVFRLSVYLKKEVVPALLQMALNFTVGRFPSFATTLKKGFFWHYLDTAKRRFTVESENDIPCQPLKLSQSLSQSFRVVYHQNRISVEFFHGLTDGTGGMVFLKALTAEYLRLTGVTIPPDENLWDNRAVPTAAEFENAFSNVEQSKNGSGFANKPAIQLSGRLSKAHPCRILHFKMDTPALKAAAARYQTTVTVYLLSLMFLAIRGATDELKGEASIQVPVNMRKFYPTKTVRNFSMFCGIRLPIEEIADMETLTQQIAKQLTAKAARDSMTEMLTATVKLVAAIKYIPLAIKQPVAKIVYGFLGDKTFTTTLSNLGVVRLPECMAQEIESMDFVLGATETNRVNCAAVTLNDITCLSITKSTVDPSFEERLYDLLMADGIHVTAEGSALYED